MRRREIIALIGAAVASPTAWTLAARAQQRDRMRRVGVLMGYTAIQPEGQSYFAAFVEGLRQSGWIEGQNLRIDVRWNAGDARARSDYAAQLIGLMPDVIVASTTINLTEITKATSRVPVVFVTVTDPVAQGFVVSVRHPGGNLTGFSNNEFSLGGKWLDLLKKVSPGLARVAVCVQPETSLPNPNSSCRRSRAPRSFLASRSSQCQFASMARSNPRWRVPQVSRTAA